jgi:hypothetical protein
LRGGFAEGLLPVLHPTAVMARFLKAAAEGFSEYFVIFNH